MPPHYNDVLDYKLIDEDKLQTRIQALGQEITSYYENLQADDIMLVGILKGCTLFLTDLMRQVDIPHQIDFMDVTSYGIGVRQTTRDVRILMDLHQSIEGKHVLIVEDIIDSGQTLHRVMDVLRTRKPASLTICTLLDKEDRREVDIPLTFVGFSIPDVFVFGYGLDIDEYYRNLPFIGVAKPDAIISED